MEKNVQITGKTAVTVSLIIIVVLVAIRMVTFSDSHDATLEKAVRAELWINYGDRLSDDIANIRKEADYESVPALLEKASPDAITIERISRSEPLLSWSSNQEVIVRVNYLYPDDTKTQTAYMKFNHGPVGDWSYRYETSAAVYYLNFL